MRWRSRRATRWRTTAFLPTALLTTKPTRGGSRRVGVVSSGTKVAYTFLNPLAGGYDLTQAEWDLVAVRAGQRMTQVP